MEILHFLADRENTQAAPAPVPIPLPAFAPAKEHALHAKELPKSYVEAGA